MVWANNDYGYKKKITIDHTLVAGDETDFPVLISVTDADLADDSNGGHVKSSDGYDIVFYNDDEDTLLKHEIERYVNTSGLLVFWVKVNSLSSTVDTDIYIYYGKTGVVVDPSTTDTWDANFIGVYHMNDASGGVTDSTSNGLDGVENGNPTYHQTGKTGYCIDFDGTGDYFNITDDAYKFDGECSFEIWVNLDAVANHYGIFGFGDTDYFPCYDCYRQEDKWTNEDFFMIPRDGSGQNTLSSGFDPVVSTWYQCVLTHETVGNDDYLYVDGVEKDNLTSRDVDLTTAGNFHAFIGLRVSAGHAWNGQIDEFRVSDTARSSNWVSTTHETQDDPGNFVDFAAEEEKPDSGETVDDTFDISDSVSLAFSFVFASADDFEITDINLVAEAILIADTFSMDDHTSIWKNAFVIQSDTYTIYITKPEWRGLDGQIVKDIALFDFWNENYSTVDKGIDSRDRHLQGVESVINDISDTVEKIWSMQNNKEEVTITCLGETINGVYIIESFDFKTIKGTNAAYSWSINLKFVRDV